MILKNGILADHVLQGDSGKKTIFGVFGRIVSFEYPTTHPKMYMYLEFIGELDESGEHGLDIVLVDGDYNPQGELPHSTFVLPKPPEGLFLPTLSTEVVHEIQQFGVQAPGMYEFRIKVDGKQVGYIPLTMLKIDRTPEHVE